jgi:hypothetical protein
VKVAKTEKQGLCLYRHRAGQLVNCLVICWSEAEIVRAELRNVRVVVVRLPAHKRKHLPFQLFLPAAMFVPSLSWVNDHFLVQKGSKEGVFRTS